MHSHGHIWQNSPMSNTRFTNAKYIRQLRAMYDDIAWWRLSYLESAAQTTSQELALRFERRAAVLEDATYQLVQLMDTLFGLPRIS
jgi:hypothetical protein